MCCHVYNELSEVVKAQSLNVNAHQIVDELAWRDDDIATKITEINELNAQAFAISELCTLRL